MRGSVHLQHFNISVCVSGFGFRMNDAMFVSA